jgi:hypothetical protein
LDRNSSSTGDCHAISREQSSISSNKFEGMEFGFPTPIEVEIPKQDSHNPSISEDFINMEDVCDVRQLHY